MVAASALGKKTHPLAVVEVDLAEEGTLFLVFDLDQTLLQIRLGAGELQISEEGQPTRTEICI